MWIIFKRRFYPCLWNAIKEEAGVPDFFLFLSYVILTTFGTTVAWSQLFYSGWKPAEKVVSLIAWCLAIAMYRSTFPKVIKRVRAEMNGLQYVPDQEADRSTVSTAPTVSYEASSGLTQMTIYRPPPDITDAEFQSTLEAIKLKTISMLPNSDPQLPTPDSEVPSPDENAPLLEERDGDTDLLHSIMHRSRHPSKTDEQSSSE